VAGMTATPASMEFWTDGAARDLLHDMFMASIASADPAKVLARHLPPLPKGRCIVVGAGKAAGAMAVAVEAAWPDVDLSGVVVAPYGYGASTKRIVVCEAAHPVPDANSEVAARKMLAAVQGLTSDDLVLALISGGGSSVLSLPAEGLTLADKQVTNRALLASGLDIRMMNAIRRRLSAIKGGKLAAAAAPARVVTLAISDIPGDDPGAIASGPTVQDGDALVDVGPAVDKLAHDRHARGCSRRRCGCRSRGRRRGHDSR
jgi:glycerate 2-kinase